MAEMAMSREYHGNAMLVAGLDNLFVADGSTRLDDGLHAILSQRVDVVTEWEERVRRAHQARSRNTHALACLVSALARKLRGIDAVGLAGTHADTRMILGDQDRI